MLTKMSLENFLSFREKVVFDFSTSKYTILENRNVSDTGALKGALFIGANASGKTNALRGIGFLIRLMTGDGVAFQRYKCAYSPSKVIHAEYEFVFQQDIVTNKVKYSIAYDVQEKELTEHLMIDEKEVLTRLGREGKLVLGESVTEAHNLDSETLFLRTSSFDTGRFPQEPVLRKLINYLFNSYYINGYNQFAYLGKNVNKYAEENGVEKLNSYLRDFNYDFSVEYGSESTGEGINLRVASNEKSIFLKRRSFPVPSIFIDESQGNQVFLEMLPNLINVIEQPGMLVVDEFGNSLHNRLAEKIISFFMEKSTYSQLFITSHDTNLISNSVFRPDQINLIKFKNEKGSQVVRVSKYKPREAQNLEKMYLGGMFEGLPSYEKIQD